MAEIPRPEYPRMQFVRQDWLNLNGIWTYEFDFGESGVGDLESSPVFHAGNGKVTPTDRGLLSKGLFANAITVPFCPESKLSGVEYKDFIPSMFYAREITIPEQWRGKRIIIHFGGVDNIASLYIDGQFAGRHKGGQCSFEFDITPLAKPGQKQILTLQVIDHLREGLSGGGKQSPQYQSHGCCYTRVTGIWATVWLEPVASEGLKRCQITPDFDNGAFVFTPEYYALPVNGRLEVEIFAGEKTVAQYSGGVAQGIPFSVKPSEFHAWTPDDPFLYGLKFRLFNQDGEQIDEVDSYGGLRKISIVKDRLYLNNQPFFPRFVLDQGFYPDGIWTAPDDTALQNDIILSKAAGFNGARLHQKVFEERFHYHADRLGYLTCGEYGNWGLRHDKAQARENFLGEWREIVCRDVNHPSIIAWCPLNETISPFQPYLSAQLPNLAVLQNYRDWVTAIYELTKSLDPARPTIDTSGFLHVITDIWSVHCYCRDAEEMKAKLFPSDGGVMSYIPEAETGYTGQPYLCNEFGGFKYIPPDRREGKAGWGYWNLDIKTPQQLCDLIRAQVELLVNSPAIGGFCYTQLTDIEQEQNGIYNYDRTPKFPVEMISEIFSQKPEWSAY